MIARVASIGIGFALLAESAAVRADEIDAAAQFNYGRAEMIAGHYTTGCPALESSFQLDPRPGTLFTLAECDLKWGRTASALSTYEQYLALYDRMSPEQRTKQAERARIASTEREMLQTSVPRLSVRLSERAPAGIVVERDDIVLGGPMLGAKVPVDPGEHVVRVRMPDGRVVEQRVTLAQGDARVVVAQLPALDEPAAALPAPSPTPLATPAQRAALAGTTLPGGVPTHRRWTLVAGGVGIAGGIVAGITGGLALSKKPTIASECNALGVCATQQGVDAGNTARTLANAETAALAVAGAGVVAAIVLWLTESPAPRLSARGSTVACLATGVAAVW
jgi:hypothetical protein